MWPSMHSWPLTPLPVPVPVVEQTFICMQLRFMIHEPQEAAQLDGSGRPFVQDRWDRDSSNPNAGFGITAVLEGGNLLEKAAANVSIIRGILSPVRAQAMSSRGRGEIDPKGGQPYAAAALSLVFHSAHPRVPTLRGDVRLFQV